MSRKKSILYVQSSGVDTPERSYAPFVLATTASMMNIDATIYFLIKGVTVVKKGEAEKIKLGSFPSLKEVIDQAIRAGVKLLVCEQSTQLLGLSRGDFLPEAKVVGAATLNDLALDADAILCF
ncbi:MAG: DsrE family protein [Candidatus Bathyarchaeota archaeon]|nr:DsrE family protein [Candidatus Bathyarchaeota archaeon]MDH5746740.1 DsrE family protein [Candidatus Bathyarchaeota archaeon]